MAILGYILLLAFWFLQATGGVNIAVASATLHRSREVATALLTTLLIFALAASLGLGLGTSRVFSESVLRRFPLTRGQRFGAQLVTGILEPLWLTITVASVGMAAGFSTAGLQRFPLSLLAAGFFLVTSFFLVTCLVALVGGVVRSSLATSMVAALSTLAVGLAVSMPEYQASAITRSTLPWLSYAFAMSPPSLAAWSMTTADGTIVTWAFVALLGWTLVGVILFASVALTESASGFGPRRAIRLTVLRKQRTRRMDLDGLLYKALLYHWRCSRIRLSAAIGIPLICLITATLAEHSDHLAALPYLFLASPLIIGALSFNQLGYDAGGTVRHLLMPHPPESAVRAAVKASLIVGSLGAAISVAVWLLVFGSHVDIRQTIALILAATGGVPAFAALGMWVSVAAPRPASLTGLLGNPVSPMALFVQSSATAVTLYAASWHSPWNPLHPDRSHWWVTACLPLFGIAFCWTSLVLLKQARPTVCTYMRDSTHWRRL